MATPQQDRLLNAEEVAARLQVTPAFVYKKARDYPFTIRQGRYVRFSQNGLTKYLDRHQGK
jgi:predicted DNA-binding transcriptional regulator AlpA